MSTLTRHFYALDEVVAALSHCCKAGRPKEACFWLQELIDSGEAAFAIKAMVETYIFNCGVMHLGWLKAAYEAFATEEVTEDALYEICIALCRISVRDYSLIGLHLVRMADCRSGVAPKLEGVQPEGTHQYFMEALRQGNVRAAFWAANSVDVVAMLRTATHSLMVGPLEIIYGLNGWAGTAFASHTILCLLLMTCGLRLDEFEATLAPPIVGIPATILEERIQWAALLGRRARRLYTVPNDCFYLVTQRGRMPWSASTDADLRRVGDKLTTAPYLRNCEFWNDMIDECTEGSPDKDCFADDEDCFADDESWENFANKAFVDDIPDEWSAEERLKSHGPGKCGQATACATVSKWLRYNVSTNEMGVVTFRGCRFLAGCELTAKREIDFINADRHVPISENWSADGWLGTLWLQANTDYLDTAMMGLANGLAAINTSTRS
jgi:hypothetical protein